MSVVSEIAALATRVGGEIKAVRSWVTTQLAGKANTAHAHAAADTTTGTFALARIPTGTTSSTVALGDHAHSGYAAGLTPTASRTASHTATPGEYVMADASSGAFTVTLPATGSAGVKKTDTSANLVTVAAASGKTLGTLGAASIPLRLPDQAMITQVSGNNHVITHGYQSLAELDKRFAAPNALDRIHAALSTRVDQPVRVVFTGSSTTAGFVASTPAANYVSRLAAALQVAYPAPGGVEVAVANSLSSPPSTPGVQPFNAGVSATNSSDYISTALRNQIVAAGAAVVMHMIGSNDLYNGTAPATYKANVQAQITAIRSSLPLCTHVLVHSYPRLDVTSPTYPWSAYGQALREIADASPTDVMFVDLSDAYTRNGVPGADPLDLVSSDDVHQGDRGHAFMADLLRRALRIVGGPSPPVAGSAGGATRTAARWTSEGAGGTSTTNIVGRATDVTLGGNAKTWVGDASVLATNGSAIVRGSASTTPWFAGLAEPHRHVETSVLVSAVPTGSGGSIILDIHRASSAGSGNPNAYRAVIAADSSLQMTKRVSGTTTTLASGLTFSAGDRIALRYFDGLVELRKNGALVASVADSSLPAAGFSGIAGTSIITALTLDDLTIDVLT